MNLTLYTPDHISSIPRITSPLYPGSHLLYTPDAYKSKVVQGQEQKILFAISTKKLTKNYKKKLTKNFLQKPTYTLGHSNPTAVTTASPALEIRIWFKV